jgi:hypothetical protein
MRNLGILSLILAAAAVTPGTVPGAQPAPAMRVAGDLCTGGQALGTGLRGAYYSADPKISQPVLVRVDPRISDAALRGLPKPFAARPPAAVRWCGWIRPIATGPHLLQSSVKGLRVEIGKQLVPRGTPVQMEAGTAYAIRIELPDPAAAGQFSLQWTPPFGATYDIPPTVLFPPVATVEPGC